MIHTHARTHEQGMARIAISSTLCVGSHIRDFTDNWQRRVCFTCTNDLSFVFFLFLFQNKQILYISSGSVPIYICERQYIAYKAVSDKAPSRQWVSFYFDYNKNANTERGQMWENRSLDGIRRIGVWISFRYIGWYVCTLECQWLLLVLYRLHCFFHISILFFSYSYLFAARWQKLKIVSKMSSFNWLQKKEED